MNASVGSSDSSCEASESDLSSDPDNHSHNSCHSLEKTKSNPKYCGSSTPSDLSSTSMESFHWNQHHTRAIVPVPSSKDHNEFDYTTVTPICYRNTADTTCSTESPKTSHIFQSENYGLGKKRTAVWKENTTNISNNDNDYGTQGLPCRAISSRAQYFADQTNFEAVVMPCCDEPPRNFYYEQSRFPAGCLDVVLNGNDRNFESDTCSDYYRESGCESDDTMTRCFRSATLDAGTGYACSRSWCSLNSFDGCEGLEEILSGCSDPVDCFKDELMCDDVELLPVSVSLQSLSSSVGVDVRYAERILCVDTLLRNSDEEDGEEVAMVDTTILAKNSGCSEDDKSQYEVGLINNYIYCADDIRIGEQDWVKPLFDTCGKSDGTGPDGGKRWIREQEQRACWESEVAGIFGGRKPDAIRWNLNLGYPEQITDGTQNKTRRKNVALVAQQKSSTKAAARRRRRIGGSSSKPSTGSSEDPDTDLEQQLAPGNSNWRKAGRAKKTQNSYYQMDQIPAPSALWQTKRSVPENEFQRNFLSLEAAGNKSQSVTIPTWKATSEPAGIGKQKSGTKRSYRIQKLKLKGIDASYHEPHEAAIESAEAPTTPEPLPDRAPVQAAASFHQPDVMARANSVPNKSIHYDPTSVTILAAGGELFGRPFRQFIPVLYPIRAIVSYEDDHGLRKNRTTGTVTRKFNRAKTKSNPAFAERLKLLPSVRSSRAAVQQSVEELSQPLSLASIKYMNVKVEEGEHLVRIPSTEAQYAPSTSQSVIGYVESISEPRLVSAQEIDLDDSTPPRKQSVSFADMNPAFEDLLSMYPSFLLRRSQTEDDELYLRPSGPIPNLPALVDDKTLSPSELLARVAAASDRELMRPSVLPCQRSDAIGTSVTQVVSRWRKHYMDNDPCFPVQEGRNTWVRSLNAKTIQFNKDVSYPTKPADCKAVETNKIIYYQNTSCVDPTESQLSCSSYSSDSEFTDARPPFWRGTDSTPTVRTVSPARCGGRPQTASPSSTGGCRRRRVSSADRSVDALMRIVSSSISRTRLDEGDRNSSNLLLYGGSLRGGGSRIQREDADDLERSYVEALLASIRSTTKQFVQGVIANKATPQQQQQQQRRQPLQGKQHQSPQEQTLLHQQQQYKQRQQQQQQRQRQQQQQEGLSESVLTDYPSNR